MINRKQAFGRHKAPKQNIRGDRSSAVASTANFSQPTAIRLLSATRAHWSPAHVRSNCRSNRRPPFGHNARRIQRDRKSLAETRWRTNMPPTTTMEISDTTMITMVVTKVVATGMSRMIIITVRMFLLHQRFFSEC